MSTALKIATPAKLLNRIRDLSSSIELFSRKLHRQKIDLWMTTYLYIETVCTKKPDYDISDVCVELASAVGGSASGWRSKYKYGKFIRDNKLDPEQLIPSSIAITAQKRIDNKPHLRVLCNRLQEGTGPSQMHRELAKRGYDDWSVCPRWRVAQIKKSRLSWNAWTTDLNKLAAQIRETTDAKGVKVKVTVEVNGKKVVTGSYRE